MTPWTLVTTAEARLLMAAAAALWGAPPCLLVALKPAFSLMPMWDLRIMF